MNKYYYLENYFDIPFTEYFQEIAEKHEYVQGLVVNADGTVALDEKRKCEIIPINPFQEPGLVQKLLFVANRLNLNFQFDINGIREITMTKYQVGGEYDWHQDVNWRDYPSHRKLTIIIQLTNPESYDGGDLNLMDCNISEENAKALRKQGTVIVFPSILKHRITPITRGVRKSLVAWAEGPTWR